MQVNCNAGIIKTNRKGEYRRVEAWYIPKGIANIFYINETEKLHRFTYDIIDRYYMVHTDKGPVCFHKDEQGLTYIDLDASAYDAATYWYRWYAATTRVSRRRTPRLPRKRIN